MNNKKKLKNLKVYRNKYTREFSFDSANDSIQHDRTNYFLPEIRVIVRHYRR